MKCRYCGELVTKTFIDLGNAPPSNSYLTNITIKTPEKMYPLKVMVCEQCWLVQTDDFVGVEELFSDDYAYFSSFSTTWVEHAKLYINDITNRFNLGKQSCIVEIAANDGYLLQFAKEKNIPCYGIEPTNSTAVAARKKGIEIIEAFFGVALAKKLIKKGRRADLIVGNNVLAHVPDINDFIEGVAMLLKTEGIATFEFPHLLRLVKENQFDTIYHEHYSYLSLSFVDRIISNHDMIVFDVEELSTHGGSLRVFVQLKDTGKERVEKTVSNMLSMEEHEGIKNMPFYEGLQQQAQKIKTDLLSFLRDLKKQGKCVAAYGAAAKGNTMLNYAGVTSDLLPYVVDKNPAKQGKYMPGSHIPIVEEDVLKKDKPDYVLILPWNLKSELMNQLAYIREWKGQFVTAIPQLEIQ